MTRISGSSSMPNRSWTRSRISATKASTSSALAPPRLTMKFACFVEICAPPPVLDLAAEGARVAKHRSADGARDTRAKLQPGPACPGRLRRQLGHQGPGGHGHGIAVDRNSSGAQFDGEPGQFVTGEQRVG